MEKIERTQTPGWLKDKWREWGEAWAAKLDKNEKSRFNWHNHAKKGRKDLVKELSLMTQEHCSFCDGSPMGGLISSTIDPFRPKRKQK